MPSLLLDAPEGRGISVGAQAVRPAVAHGNNITVRLGRAWYSMPRDDRMGTMIAGGPCCELTKGLFVATIHLGFENN
jgi:hypothetical protein